MAASKGPPTRNSAANASPSQLQLLGRKVREFSFGIYKLRNLRDVPADMADEYRRVLATVTTIEKGVTTAFGSLATVAAWAGLSALPLVPLAMAAAVTAGVVYGSRIILDFMRRVDARRIQAGKPGMSYAEALAQSDTGSGDGSFFGLDLGGKYVLPILALGAVWFLFGRK